MAYDPDQPDAGYRRTLVQMLESRLAKIRQMILHPPGASAAAVEWNRHRAQILLAQIQKELSQLRQDVATWSADTLRRTIQAGWQAGQRQLEALAWKDRSLDPTFNASFAGFNPDTIRTLANDTYRDLERAIDQTQRRLQGTLYKMADNGLTAAQVNQIIAGGVIEGKPRQVIAGLRDELRAIHGQELTINGRNYDTKVYGQMVANTRLREAAVLGRHARLQKDDVLHVVIIGNSTQWPCTAYLGHIYYLGDGSDPAGYPNLDTLDGPPFHPNCSKSTAPIVLQLASKEQLQTGKPDEASRQMAQVGVNSTAGRRLMQADNVQGAARQRQRTIVRSITRQQQNAPKGAPPKKS